MESLYAPWRNPYSQSNERSKEHGCSPQDCAFCVQLQADQDAQNFILKRTHHLAILFNRYPYNSGHLLIIPYQHVDSLDKLPVQARAELMELANASMLILQEIIAPHGFNMGLNTGKAAGAGMPSHLHLHVLPRWHGDTNFLPTLGATKTISVDLNGLYQLLLPKFQELTV